MKNLLTILIVLFVFLGCSRPSKNESTTIAIQPFVGFPKNLTDTIKQAIEDYYHFNTTIYKEITIPKEFYTTIKSPRYRADSIISFLKLNKADSINHIIGLTTSDISVTKYDNNGKIKTPASKYQDWGVFGLGYRPGASCIISTYRIKHPNQQKYIDRIKKITLHELGHNLGLPHCKNEQCFMRDAAETIKTVDQVELNLCDKCFSKI